MLPIRGCNQLLVCKDSKKYSYTKSPTNGSQDSYLVSIKCAVLYDSMSYIIKIIRARGQVGRVCIPLISCRRPCRRPVEWKLAFSGPWHTQLSWTSRSPREQEITSNVDVNDLIDIARDRTSFFLLNHIDVSSVNILISDSRRYRF